MKFTNISLLETFPNATRPPTDNELKEILKALNNHNFSTRTELSEENDLYQDPPDLKYNDHCHATARKYAATNENLVVVSGYLIEFGEDKALLISHSVVKDTETNIIWEPMVYDYPINQYEFIEYSTEIKGHNLRAY